MPDQVPSALTGPVPFVLAHRGFDLSGLENSMRAFEAAVRLGVTFLETDVRATADGALIAFHDATLDRVTDSRGKIVELPWRQVRTARIGGQEPIPLLEDVLGSWPDVRVNVDLKAPTAVARFVEVVRRTRSRNRVVVASFSERRRADAVRELQLDGPVAWSPASTGVLRVVAAVSRAGRNWSGRDLRRRDGSGRDLGGRDLSGDRSGKDRVDVVRTALAGAACLQVPERIGPLRVVTERLVRAVHAAGAQVHVWTVDDPTAMVRLLDLGVDALVTNRVDLAVELLKRRSDSHSG
jgi:glycerophosphoryl diester phosphodiesterase